MRAFEEIIDTATQQLGDYSSTYDFFRTYWPLLIAEHPNLTLGVAINIKEMFDLTQKYSNAKQNIF